MRLAAFCSVHGENISPVCPVCQEAKTLTWEDNVRVNEPDAPEWKKEWAKVMDDLDRLERSLGGLSEQNRERAAALAATKPRRKRKHWWS